MRVHTFQHGKRRWLVAGTGLAVVAALSVAPNASAAQPDPGTVAVPQGTVAPLAAGTAVGKTATSTPLDVSIILRARQLEQLKSRVANGWTGPFLTTAQFAATYGQTPAVIKAIEDYLHSYGITTSTYADRLDIHAHGTVAQFNKAMHVSLTNYRVDAPSANGNGKTHKETVHGTLDNPRVPKAYGSVILAVLGLSNYAPNVSHASPAPHKQVSAHKALASGIPEGMQTPADFAKRYHLDGLQKKGSLGQGRTAGIITLASFDPNQAFTFWNTYLGLNEPRSRLNVVTVDGGAGPISDESGSTESDLDVQQTGAIASKAKVRVYVAPNTDPGFADAFFAAASDNIADTVSSSWGESETDIQAAIAEGSEPAGYIAVFDEVFAEFGAQGQSNFSASGDSGAYDAVGTLGTTNLAVDAPGSSPLTTSAGGTTLPGTQTYSVFDADGNPTGATMSANIPSERAWSWDYFFPMWKGFGYPDEKADVDDDLAGDGGGYSALESRPSYQQGIGSFNARKYLTPKAFTEIAPGLVEPTDYNFTATPGLSSGSESRGRGVPDVSTNGDPETGYAVYDADLLGGFEQFGGTSFVSPQLNASTAVIDSAVGHRVGFWNPKIYPLARKASSPFSPLNDTTAYSGVKYLYTTSASGKKTALSGAFSNNNLYYTGKPGAYWNPATGLGLPNLTALAGQLK
jgi:kumamolisin